MTDLHHAYLNLGSNVDPQLNLPKAVHLLREYGQIAAVSTVWESPAVGFDGPNFLNACVLFDTHLQPFELKEQVIRPIETKLGRVRTADKNAPRTMDIDLVLFDEQSLKIEYWGYAFVIFPLAELIPDFINPVSQKTLSVCAGQTQGAAMIVPRGDVSL